MKTLSDFKRALTVGTKLETLALASNVSGVGRLKVGDVRTILEANSVGVYLATEGGSSRGSFLGFDKSADWVFQGDVATNTKVGYSYRVIKEG
jgi:hypothetical protein